MSSDDSLSRREFIGGMAALGLLSTAPGCIREQRLRAEPPCRAERVDDETTRLTCVDDLRGHVRDETLILETDSGRRRYDEVLRFGYGTDLHFADASTSDDKLAEGTDKLREAVEQWNLAETDFVVMGGDYVEADTGASPGDGIADLKAIEQTFDELKSPRHYALGNHDFDVLTKGEFLTHAATDEPYYSFDRAGYHFVVLDPNYSEFSTDADYERGEFSYLDTWCDPAQLEWLERDLDKTDKPTLVFSHQRLSRDGMHFVENAAEIRSLFATGDVRAVFEGHSHENENTVVDDTHYICMEAMVEGTHPTNAYAVVHLYEGDYLFVEGFGQQNSYLRALA